MSTTCRLTAIGPFKKELAKNLCYPEEYYEDVEDGTKVISTILFSNTSHMTRELAKTLGVKIDDFETHQLNKSLINFNSLAEVLSNLSIEEAAEDLRILLDNEFLVMFELE